VIKRTVQSSALLMSAVMQLSDWLACMHYAGVSQHLHCCHFLLSLSNPPRPHPLLWNILIKHLLNANYSLVTI